MAAVEKFVLDNPFRPSSALGKDAPPGPCVIRDDGFARETSEQQRGPGASGQRVPKRRLPAWDFGCDSCDQGFASQADLSAHRAEHVVCPRDDCGFEASPAVVALHQKLQHNSPFIRRTAAVGADEDVEEWRRQRRLRYPTLQNIEAKKAAEVERQARREVINEDVRGGRRRKRHNKRRQRAHRRASPVNRVHQPPWQPQRAAQPEPSPIEEEKAAPCEDEPDQITDSDGEQPNANGAKPPESSVSGVLASLMACYGSDDDETAVEDSSRQVQTNKQEASEEAPPPAPSKALPAKVKPAVRPKATSLAAGSAGWPHRRKLTLLQRLLASEMRRERNVILQCVHHVVDHDFFGQAGPKDT
ncbi:nuclear FMR1 interacting protein 1 [Rhipicephalus microplus]|uniref:nuclear FMR1 interacting protein 1 n=1 Tax=Rhipicephalus microplus TaxID=6941 RepID=UPI003F6B6592